MMELGNVGAIFSEDRKYRYVLWRAWEKNPRMLQFIGLNPSTANESKNDNTIKRLIRITRHNGYGGFYMTNLFGIISTDPDLLLTHPDPVGDNDRYLTEISEKSHAVVFCWGRFKQAKERGKEIMSRFPDGYCINRCIDGSPVHPLLQPGKSDIKKYRCLFDLLPNGKMVSI